MLIIFLLSEEKEALLMRKVLSILLTLVLCIGLIPVMAVPVHAVDTYDVWVGDTQITSENKDAIPSVLGGTAEYDPTNHTLTFNGVTGIQGSSTFSYMDGSHNTSVTVKIGSKNVDLVIKGDVNIDASNVGHGIFVSNGSLTMEANMTITGATVYCIETDGAKPMYANSGTYNISGRHGVNINNTFYIKDGVSFTANATGDDCDGISSLALYITNATVDATGTEAGIYTYDYNQNGGNVKSRGGEEGLRVGYYSSNSPLVVSGNATLEAWSGDGYAALFSQSRQYSLANSVYIKEPAGGSFQTVNLNNENVAAVVDSNNAVATHVLIAPKPTYYNLWVAGVQLNSDNLVIDSADNAAITSGSATYVPATKTLTLNNFVFEGAGYDYSYSYDYYAGIYYKGSGDVLTIDLVGDNRISETGAVNFLNADYCNSHGIYTDGPLSFSGSGTLTAIGGKAKNYHAGIEVNGTLSIPADFNGTINGSVVDYEHAGLTSYGIFGNRIIIAGGTINATGNTYENSASYGFGNWYDDSFTISGGTVTASGVTKVHNNNNLTITSGYAEVSTDTKGTSPVVYDGGDIRTYKWMHYPSSMTPTTPYDLYVGNVQVTSANKDNVLEDAGTPTVTYDPSTATLYLTDANIDSFHNHGSNDSSGIYTKSDLTIILSGDNTISVVNAPENNDVHGINLDEDGLSLTIGGDGSLDIRCGASGSHYATCIEQWPYSGTRNKLMICDSAKVKAEAVKGNSSFGAVTVTGDILLCDDAQLTVRGGDSDRGSVALACSFSLVIKDNAQLITIGGDNAPTSFEYEGTTYTNESKLSIAIQSNEMTVQDNAVVAATGGIVKASDDAESIGIQGNLIINGGTVAANTRAAQGKAQALSSAPVLASGLVAGGSINSDGKDAVEYDPADNSSYKWFKTPFTVVPKVDTPTFSPADGTTFTDSIDVTISIPDGATVYYTDDGSEPSETNGTVTTGAAITLDETTTLKAIAVKDGFADSDIAEATYTKTEPAPSGGGGGGGGSAPETYAVTPAEAENGKIEVSSKNAAEDDKVTITVTPDEGYELDKLIVKDKDGNEIEVTDNGDGTYTFKMPDSEVEIEPVFKEAEPETPAEDEFPFVDVPEDAYFRKAVEWALEEGVTGGTTPTTFSPKAPATRAQMITFLWAASGAPDPETTENPFKDVSEDAYYYKAVMWAYEKGITAGVSEDMFGPDQTVTRAQAATFLYGVAGRPDTGSEPFTDVNDGDYFEAPVAWAFKEGITTGTSETTFSPDADCLREQIITFMYLYFTAE